MPNEKDSAALVVTQDGDWVEVDHKGERVTVAMKGFPPNFKLQSGDRVILLDEPSGTVARPLVRVMTTTLSPDALSKGGPLEVQGRRLEIQAATISEQRGAHGSGGRGDQYVVWALENSGTDRIDRVIAFRKTR